MAEWVRSTNVNRKIVSNRWSSVAESSPVCVLTVGTLSRCCEKAWKADWLSIPQRIINSALSVTNDSTTWRHHTWLSILNLSLLILVGLAYARQQMGSWLFHPLLLKHLVHVDSITLAQQHGTPYHHSCMMTASHCHRSSLNLNWTIQLLDTIFVHRSC